MKFIKQTVAGKRKGDCLGACLSSLTGIPLSVFPLYYDEEKEGDWNTQINVILKKYGYQIICFNFDKKTLEEIKVPIIASGHSPNYKDNYHAVLWQNNKILFDPSHSNKGLKGEPRYYILILPYFD